MQEILDRIMGGEDLRAICQDEHLPCFRTVFYWLEDDPELEFAYRRARRGYAAAQAHKATILADKLARFEVPKDGVRGVEVAIKHYQWLAERMDPAQWGQRLPTAPAAAIQIITNAFSAMEGASDTIVIEAPSKRAAEKERARTLLGDEGGG